MTIGKSFILAGTVSMVSFMVAPLMLLAFGMSQPEIPWSVASAWVTMSAACVFFGIAMEVEA